MSWVRALRAGLPDDGVVLNDLTQVGFVAELGFEARDPHSFVTAGYQGTLGYGFPTALGFKVGAPDRQVVALCGDGGFGYALQELSTARRERIGVTVMLFVDDWYGNVRRTQKEDFDGRFLGVTLGNPDFVALARAYGIEASRIDPNPARAARCHRSRAGRDPAGRGTEPLAPDPLGAEGGGSDLRGAAHSSGVRRNPTRDVKIGGCGFAAWRGSVWRRHATTRCVAFW
jgi:hypothetical protein